MFNNIYGGKKVLVTGHTGFKGAWLCQWLLKLGARVVGVSKDIPTNPSLFATLDLQDRLNHVICDVRDLDRFGKLIKEERPDFIFHLAAQAIVSQSYEDPVETVSTNVLGTMNVLDALRSVRHKCVAVLITSDKCYENVEWIWGYKETDQIGGKDIYSGSKGAAELIIHSYLESFFSSPDSLVRIGVGRAGNVIGGGDWAKDRIVVDTVLAWASELPVEIRSPDATRPWQHVLEPISGYLCLGAELWGSAGMHGEAFNFGPSTPDTHKVIDLLNEMYQRWFGGEKQSFEPYILTASVPFNEAGLLKLNCDKAKHHLGWSSTLSYEQTVRLIVDWYKAYYSGAADIRSITNTQIEEFEKAQMLLLSP